MLDSFTAHIRHAARLIARTPMFAVTAILSLAIGIGAISQSQADEIGPAFDH